MFVHKSFWKINQSISFISAGMKSLSFLLASMSITNLFPMAEFSVSCFQASSIAEALMSSVSGKTYFSAQKSRSSWVLLIPPIKEPAIDFLWNINGS
jgi:hypothetical protein